MIRSLFSIRVLLLSMCIYLFPVSVRLPQYIICNGLCTAVLYTLSSAAGATGLQTLFLYLNCLLIFATHIMAPAASAPRALNIPEILISRLQ